LNRLDELLTTVHKETEMKLKAYEFIIWVFIALLTIWAVWALWGETDRFDAQVSSKRIPKGPVTVSTQILAPNWDAKKILFNIPKTFNSLTNINSGSPFLVTGEFDLKHYPDKDPQKIADSALEYINRCLSPVDKVRIDVCNNVDATVGFTPNSTLASYEIRISQGFSEKYNNEGIIYLIKLRKDNSNWIIIDAELSHIPQSGW